MELGYEVLYWNAWSPIAADGTFRLKNLPAGEQVQVIALCDGFVAKQGTPPSFATSNERQHPNSYGRPQVFSLNELVNNVELEMKRGATVEIEVVDRQGQPVPGVTVNMSPNVGWWNGGSQIYGEGKLNSADYFDRPFAGDREPANRFVATTNEKGIARTSELPLARAHQHFGLIHADRLLPLVGEQENYYGDLEVSGDKMNRKRVVVELPADEPMREPPPSS